MRPYPTAPSPERTFRISDQLKEDDNQKQQELGNPEEPGLRVPGGSISPHRLTDVSKKVPH